MNSYDIGNKWNIIIDRWENDKVYSHFTFLLPYVLEVEKRDSEGIRNQIVTLTPQYEKLEEVLPESEDPLRLAEGTPLWKDLVNIFF